MNSTSILQEHFIICYYHYIYIQNLLLPIYSFLSQFPPPLNTTKYRHFGYSTLLKYLFPDF